LRRKSGVEKKMQITYQNEWEYTNIHVDLPIPYEEDYQIKMIHYNKIKGMLPVQGIGRDGQSRYTFRLENGMSMDKIYEEAEISGKEIEDFMEQLSVITEQIKIFLLNNNHIILDPKLIFKKAEQYYFCYLPIIKKENEPTMCEAFHELTEYFVKHLDYNPYGNHKKYRKKRFVKYICDQKDDRYRLYCQKNVFCFFNILQPQVFRYFQVQQPS
jgi:hypothetical protein